jgi:O-methyltransferase involved in polyketide biosynthesis
MQGRIAGRRGAHRLERRASLTAEVNAAQRAAETLRPAETRLLVDPFARYFVTRPAYRASSNRVLSKLGLAFLDWRYPGLHAIITLRARYSDDAVRAAAAAGADQVVLLGAGFDSTAFRYSGRPVEFFEVDSPHTQRAKRVAIERHGLSGRSVVHYVPLRLRNRLGRRAPGRRTLRSVASVAVRLARRHLLPDPACVPGDARRGRVCCGTRQQAGPRLHGSRRRRRYDPV